MSVQTEKSKVDITRLIRPTPYQVWLHRFTVLAPLWTLLALGLFFGLSSSTFLRQQNLNNILVQISTLAIFGTGMTFVLLTGEIDLSIAAIAGLAGMVAAQIHLTLEWAEPIPTI